MIAADGGAELARMLGLSVDLVVGDMDSISAETLAGIERVERHAAEKDATDLELALVAALRFEPERVLVLGGGGGRLDHLLGGCCCWRLRRTRACGSTPSSAPPPST